MAGVGVAAAREAFEARAAGRVGATERLAWARAGVVKRAVPCREPALVKGAVAGRPTGDPALRGELGETGRTTVFLTTFLTTRRGASSGWSVMRSVFHSGGRTPRREDEGCEVLASLTETPQEGHRRTVERPDRLGTWLPKR